MTCRLFDIGILFCFCFTVASTFQVDVVPGRTKEESKIHVSGFQKRLITDEDRHRLGLDENTLKVMVDKYFGKPPTHIWMKGKGMYGDKGWEEVHLVMEPVSAEIISITKRPVLIKPHVFENHRHVASDVKVSISESVTNTLSTTASQTTTLSVKGGIDYKIVSFELSASHEWGKSSTNSVKSTVSSTASTSLRLEPGETAHAKLLSNRWDFKARVRFRIKFTGGLLVDYKDTYKDHHFWYLSIVDVMKKDGRGIEFDYTEDINIDYYRDSWIVIDESSFKEEGSFKWYKSPTAYWAHGCDFRGNDIGSSTVPSSLCSQSCKNFRGCTHFAWTLLEGGTGTCWFKGGIVRRRQAINNNKPSAVCGKLV